MIFTFQPQAKETAQTYSHRIKLALRLKWVNDIFSLRKIHPEVTVNCLLQYVIGIAFWDFNTQNWLENNMSRNLKEIQKLANELYSGSRQETNHIFNFPVYILPIYDSTSQNTGPSIILASVITTIKAQFVAISECLEIFFRQIKQEEVEQYERLIMIWSRDLLRIPSSNVRMLLATTMDARVSTFHILEKGPKVTSHIQQLNDAKRCAYEAFRNIDIIFAGLQSYFYRNRLRATDSQFCNMCTSQRSQPQPLEVPGVNEEDVLIPFTENDNAFFLEILQKRIKELDSPHKLYLEYSLGSYAPRQLALGRRAQRMYCM